MKKIFIYLLICLPLISKAQHGVVCGVVDVDRHVITMDNYITIESDDLNADSLDLVELIMAFEEEFSSDDVEIEISDEDAESITTVQAAIDYLRNNGVED